MTAKRPTLDDLYKNLDKPVWAIPQKASFDIFFFQQAKLKMQEKSVKVGYSGPLSPGKTNFNTFSLPLRDPEFRFLPFDSDTVEIEVERELEEKASWLQAGKNFRDYFAVRGGYYRAKEGLFIKKVMSLADEFAEFLLGVAIKEQVPFSTIEKVFWAVTLHPSWHWKPDGLEEFSEFNKVLLPNTIPKAKSAPLLVELSKTIHSLLIECLWMLHIVVWADFRNTLFILNYYKDLEQIKQHLHTRTFYVGQMERLMSISTEDELRQYIRETYGFMTQCSVYLINFILIWVDGVAWAENPIDKSLTFAHELAKSEDKRSSSSSDFLDSRSSLNIFDYGRKKSKTSDGSKSLITPADNSLNAFVDNLFIFQIKEDATTGKPLEAILESIAEEFHRPVEAVRESFKKINITTSEDIIKLFDSSPSKADAPDGDGNAGEGDEAQALVDEIKVALGGKIAQGLLMPRKHREPIKRL